jgi:hypothetical protein
METNDFIKKDPVLMPLMQELDSEIIQLERIQGLLRKADPGTFTSPLQKVTKQLSRSKSWFKFIDDAFDECASRDPRNTSAFSCEIRGSIEDIKNCYRRDSVLMKLLPEPHEHKQVN